MKTERVKNSMLNGLSNLIINLTVTVLSFVVRTIFLKTLGEQCLGLDGLFTNILSFLSLAELGFSTSISFSLYEPLAKKNIKKINRLMSYFRNIYEKIGIIILIGGLLILPFVGFMAKDYTVSYNIYIIFFLYLINTVSTYFTSYSSILLEADQKIYKLTKIRLAFNLITYGLQLIVLLYLKNFFLFLIAQFASRFIERILTHLFIKKEYKNIDFYKKQTLEKSEKEKIKTNIKGILFHQVGGYLVGGTDNILISSIVNIATTGLYYNYSSIVAIMRNLIGSIISSTSSSFGNLNVLETNNTKRNVFNVINFTCFFLTGICIVGFYFCINPLITVWLGKKYLLNISCIIVIAINFYLNAMMLPITAVKNSSGLYYVDRYVPIIQAVINLVVSIILGLKFGLIGILLGTTISYLCTISITKPLVIYKYVFKSSSKEYFLRFIQNVLLIIVAILLTGKILSLITINSVFIKLIINALISVIVYSFLFILSYIKSNEFKYLFNTLRRK